MNVLEFRDYLVPKVSNYLGLWTISKHSLHERPETPFISYELKNDRVDNNHYKTMEGERQLYSRDKLVDVEFNLYAKDHDTLWNYGYRLKEFFPLYVEDFSESFIAIVEVSELIDTTVTIGNVNDFKLQLNATFRYHDNSLRDVDLIETIEFTTNTI